MIKNSLNLIWRWLCGLFGHQSLYKAVNSEELPDHPQPNRLYLIGDTDTHWMAAMVCPCGCGDLIQLATNPTGRPRWIVKLEKGKVVTLHPSVHRRVGCKSHFFLRNGKIIWC